MLDTYDVDDVALELADDGAVTDFRLELGDGYELDWLLPAEPRGRLRLFRMGFVTVDMDPEVLRDPCAVDYPRETWQGTLARVGPDGQGILSLVLLVMTSAPPAYHLAATVRWPDGQSVTYLLDYTG